MKKFKAFTDEANDPFINGLKTHRHGVTFITSLGDGEDGYDNQDLGENPVSRHVTHSVGTRKLREVKKRSIIDNLKKRMVRLEKEMNDVINFVKKERLRRAEKKKADEEGRKRSR